MNTTAASLALLLSALPAMAEDLCAQPAPEVMAEAAGVMLPKLPWHVANLWWNFDNACQPDKGGPDSPESAWVKKAGDSYVVEVGPIFKRDGAQRRHDLPLPSNP